MLKMLQTQLTGQFQQIAKTEEFHIEDAARSLSQALVGEGIIYVKGFEEMESIEAEALQGPEPMPKAKIYIAEDTLTEIDRVLIAARTADHPEAVKLAKEAKEAGADVIALAAVQKDKENRLKQEADFLIDTKITRPLLPFDMRRVGFPSVMTMFYAYFVLRLTIEEIMDDYQE
ncbi:DUF2529 domain-containing protein [Halobacillus salinarum]|uniref:DUF2529 domain-containing protein n=1 Tax=Halobacillus salinarum TaxID=2932257 RepID=A0ABY4ELI6_9BACI|nr:DUF2529 family protein [Halobacillus salinarum]UOQ45325.1 DUF2529 domain-containing protein [Halobacillus salinarum]